MDCDSTPLRAVRGFSLCVRACSFSRGCALLCRMLAIGGRAPAAMCDVLKRERRRAVCDLRATRFCRPISCVRPVRNVCVPVWALVKRRLCLRGRGTYCYIGAGWLLRLVYRGLVILSCSTALSAAAYTGRRMQRDSLVFAILSMLESRRTRLYRTPVSARSRSDLEPKSRGPSNVQCDGNMSNERAHLTKH